MNPASKYDDAFRRECANEYPKVSEFELACGFAVERGKLEDAARVLACPVKVNPPNWQHGRVLYSAARRLMARTSGHGMFVDVGTAKGFSAMVMSWAIVDAGEDHAVVSIDAVDPVSRVVRNSVAETDGRLLTVYEFTAPFRETKVPITFLGGGSNKFLSRCREIGGQRVRFAFIDGKHTQPAVAADIEHLLALQRPGDVTLFDDIQIAPVASAVAQIRGYSVTFIEASATRRYALAVRQ